EAGQHHFAAFHLLYFVEQLHGDRLDVSEALANSLIRQFENRVLSVIKDHGRLVLFFQRFIGDLVGGSDQAPQQRLATDDLGVVGDVCRNWQSIGEVGNEADAANTLQ